MWNSHILKFLKQQNTQVFFLDFSEAGKDRKEGLRVFLVFKHFILLCAPFPCLLHSLTVVLNMV